MWDKQALLDLIDSRLGDRQLIVVANREPYIHRYVGDRIERVQPASGVANALDPVMRACGVFARDSVRMAPDANHKR